MKGWWGEVTNNRILIEIHMLYVHGGVRNETCKDDSQQDNFIKC